MPHAPNRICGGCKRIVPGGAPCPHCSVKRRREEDARRGNPVERYGRGWTKLAKRVLAEEPLCRLCKQAGRVTASTQCDHIVPVSIAPERKQDRANLQALCDEHHDAKSAEEAARRRRGVQISGRPAP